MWLLDEQKMLSIDRWNYSAKHAFSNGESPSSLVGSYQKLIKKTNMSGYLLAILYIDVHYNIEPEKHEHLLRLKALNYQLFAFHGMSGLRWRLSRHSII